ncbi:unnamed protein product [Urochloa humidicola]
MNENLVSWNMRGLNHRSRRSAINELVRSERVSLLYLQETKLDDVTKSLIIDMLGLDYDYFALPAAHTAHTHVYDRGGRLEGGE